MPRAVTRKKKCCSVIGLKWLTWRKKNIDGEERRMKKNVLVNGEKRERREKLAITFLFSKKNKMKEIEKVLGKQDTREEGEEKCAYLNVFFSNVSFDCPDVFYNFF